MILAVLWGGARAVAFGNALGDLVVPLLLRPTVQQTNDDHGHVIATDTTGFTVGREAIIHHILADPGELLLGGNAPSDELDHRLRRLTVPDTYIISAGAQPG